MRRLVFVLILFLISFSIRPGEQDHLFDAIEKSEVGVVEKLIKNGVNVNQARPGVSLGVMKQIGDKNVSVPEWRSLPLGVALLKAHTPSHERTEIIQILLNAGAAVYAEMIVQAIDNVIQHEDYDTTLLYDLIKYANKDLIENENHLARFLFQGIICLPQDMRDIVQKLALKIDPNRSSAVDGITPFEFIISRNLTDIFIAEHSFENFLMLLDFYDPKKHVPRNGSLLKQMSELFDKFFNSKNYKGLYENDYKKLFFKLLEKGEDPWSIPENVLLKMPDDMQKAVAYYKQNYVIVFLGLELAICAHF